MDASTVWDKFQQGGPIMYVLLALSVIALARAIERGKALQVRHIVPPGLVEQSDELWQEGKFSELEQLCRNDPSVLARVVLCVVLHRRQPYAEVNSVAGDVASLAIKEHAQKIHPLWVVATLSPLLGLLGTVTGMMRAFDAIADVGSAGNPALVAGGISEALIATAFGLLVGIPALGARHYFVGRVQLLGVQLATEANTLIQRWFLAEEKRA
jgi:biopolymer transport protein ExbB